MGFPQLRSAPTGPITVSFSADVTTTLAGIGAASVLGFVALTGLLNSVEATSSQGVVIALQSATITNVRGISDVGTIIPYVSNLQNVCNIFRLDLLNGKHAFGPSVVRVATTKDTFKASLYVTTANRGPTDTVYTATGEVSGTNYTAGGVVVANAIAPAYSEDVAYWTPSAPITYTNVTLTTPFDAILLYNNTSVTKLAILVITFPAQVVTAADFSLAMPANNSATALLRLTGPTPGTAGAVGLIGIFATTGLGSHS